MSAFHRWLLKHRPYCELCTGPYPSTRIIDIQGHNKAVCDAHFQSHHPLRAGYERKVAIHWNNEHQREYDRLSVIIEKDTLDIVQLREQLATEREKVELLGESRIAVDQAELLSLREKVNCLEKQLAAEREKVQTLRANLLILLDCVDYKAHNCSANQQVGSVLPVTVIDKARAALAKMKEGK